MSPDLRSPVWLEASIRYADDGYISDKTIAERLAADTDALASVLSIITSSMSNRQLRETATNAEQWQRDLLLCEEEGPLSESLQSLKQASYLLLHLLSNSRAARSSWQSGSKSFRRQ